MYSFDAQDERAYQRWRERKLDAYPTDIGHIIHTIENPVKLADKERENLLKTSKKLNLVFYKFANDFNNIKEVLLALAPQLGLINLDDNLCSDQDKFSKLEDLGSGRATYIPYTNKSLNWHTDGYYNDSEHRIRAFLMHCVCPANSGGENAFLDPEIAYIYLRDENHDYLKALMDPKVMTIPANEEAGRQIRPAQTGPVFLMDKKSQSIYLRYTARQKNIIWKDSMDVKNALSFLHELLQTSPYIFKYRLKAGEGVVCNNVLHNRSAYEDSNANAEKRIFYRARFYNRINDASADEIQNVVNQ